MAFMHPVIAFTKFVITNTNMDNAATIITVGIANDIKPTANAKNPTPATNDPAPTAINPMPNATNAAPSAAILPPLAHILRNA